MVQHHLGRLVGWWLDPLCVDGRHVEDALELVRLEVVFQYAGRVDFRVCLCGVAPGVLEDDCLSQISVETGVKVIEERHTCRSPGVLVQEVGHIPYLVVDDNPAVVRGFVRGDLLCRPEFIACHFDGLRERVFEER
jgi:hypothetical protein